MRGSATTLTRRATLKHDGSLSAGALLAGCRGADSETTATATGEYTVSMEPTGDVYCGGYLHQGPIQNLFLTERAAQQLFPDEFGAVTSDEALFDRQRVNEIVTGGPDE